MATGKVHLDPNTWKSVTHATTTPCKYATSQYVSTRLHLGVSSWVRLYATVQGSQSLFPGKPLRNHTRKALIRTLQVCRLRPSRPGNPLTSPNRDGRRRQIGTRQTATFNNPNKDGCAADLFCEEAIPLGAKSGRRRRTGVLKVGGRVPGAV